MSYLKKLLNAAGKERGSLLAYLKDSTAAAIFLGIFYASCYFALLGESLIYLLASFALAFIYEYKSHNFHHSQRVARYSKEIKLLIARKLGSIRLDALLSYQTGKLTQLLGTDAENLAMMSSVLISMLIRLFLLPLMLLIFMLFLAPKAALCLALILLCALFYALLKRSQSAKDKAKLLESLASLEHEFIQFVQGQFLLRQMPGLGLLELFPFIKAPNALQHKHLRASSLPAFCINLTFMLLGSLAILLHADDPLLALWLLFVILRCLEPLMLLLALTPALELIKASLDDVQELLNKPDTPYQQPFLKPKGIDIRLVNLCFSYPDKPVLEKLNYHFLPNRHYAIKAPSGRGKSTLLKLLLKQLEPSSGQILIGGVDIKSMSPEQRSKLFSAVLQEAYLFFGSIKENIALGRPRASMDEIISAAKAAHIHDFIEQLELGYESQISELATNLSGGERQRIAIARAILKDAPIVLLDEISSSIDDESEAKIAQALKELTKGKSIISVSHKQGMLGAADELLCL